jgi:hypothetical protein
MQLTACTSFSIANSSGGLPISERRRAVTSLGRATTTSSLRVGDLDLGERVALTVCKGLPAATGGWNPLLALLLAGDNASGAQKDTHERPSTRMTLS